MPINVIDICLFLAFLAIVGLGYLGGVVRLLFVLVSLYLSVIVATFFYAPIGAALSNTVSALSPFTASIVAFFLLLALSTAALTLSLLKTFPTLRLPARLAAFDQVGGSALGVVAATFGSVVTVVVLNFFFGLVTRTASAGVAVSPVLLTLAGQLRASFLARYFVELSQPLFVLILPWFPNGLPAILASV
jgi:uncharacterized membrane protein required for colicin V production